MSVLATLVSGSTSQSRMVYNGGRTGKLPSWLGVLRPGTHVPVRALAAFVVAGLFVIAVWAVAHVIGVGDGAMNPVGPYAECSTLGTIVILFVYVVTMAALPRFVWSRHREQFSVVRHLVVPFATLAVVVIAGAAGIAVVRHRADTARPPT